MFFLLKNSILIFTLSLPIFSFAQEGPCKNIVGRGNEAYLRAQFGEIKIRWRNIVKDIHSLSLKSQSKEIDIGVVNKHILHEISKIVKKLTTKPLMILDALEIASIPKISSLLNELNRAAEGVEYFIEYKIKGSLSKAVNSSNAAIDINEIVSGNEAKLILQLTVLTDEILKDIGNPKNKELLEGLSIRSGKMLDDLLSPPLEERYHTMHLGRMEAFVKSALKEKVLTKEMLIRMTDGVHKLEEIEVIEIEKKLIKYWKELNNKKNIII